MPDRNGASTEVLQAENVRLKSRVEELERERAEHLRLKALYE